MCVCQSDGVYVKRSMTFDYNKPRRNSFVVKFEKFDAEENL